MAIKVKICGITNLDDAFDAIELGADYLGFNFYEESKRYVSPDEIMSFIEEIPYNIGKVGVFVNADPQLVIDIATEFNIDLLQFHGDEDPQYCAQFARPYIKAFRLNSDADLSMISMYGCEYPLIDSFVQGSYGGTGIVSNWDLARQAAQSQPIFLSGGLNTDNIESAIHTVKPFAVDVASGVEDEPGYKDYRKMEEFIRLAKSL